MVENHKSNKKFEDTADELVSIPALGFGKLAELKGLRVDLDDVVAPYIVLNKNIIDYPNLDYLGGYLNSAE